MRPIPKFISWLGIPVVIAVILISFVFHSTPALTSEEPAQSSSQDQPSTADQKNSIPSRLSATQNNASNTQQSNESSLTTTQETTEVGETKIYFLSTSATADAGKSDMSKRAFSIPPGWRVQNIEETNRKGRARIVESDSVIYAEAHAISRTNGQRDEAYITAQITLIKEE